MNTESLRILAVKVLPSPSSPLHLEKGHRLLDGGQEDDGLTTGVVFKRSLLEATFRCISMNMFVTFQSSINERIFLKSIVDKGKLTGSAY